MSKLKQRPNNPNTAGTKVPTKFRFMKKGVLIFTPTKLERAQLALGYNIRVHVDMKMQHNCGEVQIASRMDLTEQTDFKNLPTVQALPPQPQIVKVQIAPDATVAKGGGE